MFLYCMFCFWDGAYAFDKSLSWRGRWLVNCVCLCSESKDMNTKRKLICPDRDYSIVASDPCRTGFSGQTYSNPWSAILLGLAVAIPSAVCSLLRSFVAFLFGFASSEAGLARNLSVFPAGCIFVFRPGLFGWVRLFGARRGTLALSRRCSTSAGAHEGGASFTPRQSTYRS